MTYKLVTLVEDGWNPMHVVQVQLLWYRKGCTIAALMENTYMVWVYT